MFDGERRFKFFLGADRYSQMQKCLDSVDEILRRDVASCTDL